MYILLYQNSLLRRKDKITTLESETWFKHGQRDTLVYIPDKELNIIKWYRKGEVWARLYHRDGKVYRL